MLQYLVMVSFYGFYSATMPAGLNLLGQNAVAILIYERIESTVGYQMQHRFSIFLAFHVADQVSVIGNLRYQPASAEIDLHQVEV